MQARLYIRIYGEDDALIDKAGLHAALEPGQAHLLTWTVPDTASAPIAFIGLELTGHSANTLYLDTLTWQGSPHWS